MEVVGLSWAVYHFYGGDRECFKELNVLRTFEEMVNRPVCVVFMQRKDII